MAILLIDRTLPCPDVVEYEDLNEVFSSTNVHGCTLINTVTSEVLHYDEDGELRLTDEIIVHEE
jgi:hypothetical protein